ncbi:MAG TPA: winged helix-turn-helix domain-containing protein [Terriglobales bacterium]|nr:winged helix-turn-helix domain-containing protein [Terriglobales bacterium]
MIERMPSFYEFGGFRLDTSQRMLTRNGEPLPIKPKSFDALLLFVQNSGRLLEKEELMKALWPESFVEEGNLSQNIFVLRKTLGNDQSGNSFIQTIPRRGYKFVAPVRQGRSLISAKESQVKPQDAAETRTDPANSREIGSALEVIHDPFARPATPATGRGWLNPFRSLRPFGPEDSHLFFGREAERDDLLARLPRSPVLAITGASGSGKSSLVQAGLIPALRSRQLRCGGQLIDSWRIAVFRPSRDPFDYLAEVLPGQLAPEMNIQQQTEFIADCRSKFACGGDALRNAISALAGVSKAKPEHTHILLVADQLEEIFTLANQQVRQRYMDMLFTASRLDGAFPTHLVLALRSDFSSHIEHVQPGRDLEANVYNLGGMTSAQLHKSIEERLRLADTEAEPGLINTVLQDVGSRDLALLEFVLQQLWEQQFLKNSGASGRLLTSSYAEIGGLPGALVKHADEVYSDIRDEHEQGLARKIFVKLACLGENGQPKRPRVQKEALFSLGIPEEIEPLLARLASSRLISIGREGEKSFVEPSHVSLMRQWLALRNWLVQNHEPLRFEQRLVKTAERWRELERSGTRSTAPLVS